MSACPWIVAHDGRREKPFGFECLRCGSAEHLPHEPIAVREFTNRCRRFIRTHRACKEVSRAPAS